MDFTGFNLNEYKYFSPSVFVFSDEVRKMCEANRCGKYNTNWQCPSGVGEISVLKAEILSYKNAFVFSTCEKLEDSFDFEGMTAAMLKHKEITRKISQLFKDKYGDVSILAAGGCTICEKCSYPNAPCRFPEKALHSVESCGINVVQLTGDLGMKYINGENTVTYFSVILYNER